MKSYVHLMAMISPGNLKIYDKEIIGGYSTDNV